MNLKEHRLAKKLSQPQMAAVLQAVEPRIRTADVCRYETGVCLPTPAQLKLICQLIEADPDEIYSREEMDLAGCLKIGFPARGKAKDGADVYKLTVRLPKGSCKGLQAKVSACGYSSITGWLEHCVNVLNDEYKKVAPTVSPIETTRTRNKPTDKIPQKGGAVNGGDSIQ